MTDPVPSPASKDKAGAAKPASKPKSVRAPDEQRSVSDERRILDALEDDEVREALRARHKPEP